MMGRISAELLGDGEKATRHGEEISTHRDGYTQGWGKLMLFAVGRPVCGMYNAVIFLTVVPSCSVGPWGLGVGWVNLDDGPFAGLRWVRTR